MWFLFPPAMRMPLPVAVCATSMAAVSALPLSNTRLPMIVVSFCGGYFSPVSLFGTMPARLSWKLDRAIRRLPPEFEPEYPNPFHSDSTSTISALHCLHCPM